MGTSRPATSVLAVAVAIAAALVALFTAASDKECKIPGLESALSVLLPVVMDFVQVSAGGVVVMTLPDCMGCHCTLPPHEVGREGACPPPPPLTYDPDTIEALRSQNATNPFTIDCDPYRDGEACDAYPSIRGAGPWGDAAVCGVVYDAPSPDVQGESDEAATSGDRCLLTTYQLRTFRTADEAREAGAVVTHEGACGLCSTTKDLAAYMSTPDMVSAGRRCVNRVLISEEWGKKCYADLGFTEPCAAIWAYNSLNSPRHCTGLCVRHLFTPANGPEPECKLNDCLQCDEEVSGPIFMRFAGRTRRNSGLVTTILRPCSGLAYLAHEGCPDVAAEALDG